MNIIMQLQNQIDELQAELITVGNQNLNLAYQLNKSYVDTPEYKAARAKIDELQGKLQVQQAGYRELLDSRDRLKNQLKEANAQTPASLALVAENINLKNQLSAESAAEAAKWKAASAKHEEWYNASCADHRLTQQKLQHTERELKTARETITMHQGATKYMRDRVELLAANNVRLQNTLQNIAHKAIKATENA